MAINYLISKLTFCDFILLLLSTFCTALTLIIERVYINNPLSMYLYRENTNLIDVTISLAFAPFHKNIRMLSTKINTLN